MGIVRHHDVCTLPEIAEHECRKDQNPPPDDRFPAKVPHVGVQGLTPGYTEDHRGHDHERSPAVFKKELYGKDRA